MSLDIIHKTPTLLSLILVRDALPQRMILLISCWRPGADILIEDIEDTRQMLADMGLTGKVQVGNSDAGFYFNTKVLEAIDYGVNLNCLSSPYTLTHRFLQSSCPTCILGSVAFRLTILQVGLGTFLISTTSSQLHACPTTPKCTLQKRVGQR